jgi:hypothetical protein
VISLYLQKPSNLKTERVIPGKKNVSETNKINLVTNIFEGKFQYKEH